MKKILIAFICLLSFSGCKYFRGDHCNNTLPVPGTYENVYDKEATNYLIINENGTFEQVFTKGVFVKKNKGTWMKGKGNCNIYLDSLKLLHDVSDSNKSFFKQSGIHRLNNIVFIEGLGYEFDFYRVKN